VRLAVEVLDLREELQSGREEVPLARAERGGAGDGAAREVRADALREARGERRQEPAPAALPRVRERVEVVQAERRVRRRAVVAAEHVGRAVAVAVLRQKPQERRGVHLDALRVEQVDAGAERGRDRGRLHDLSADEDAAPLEAQREPRHARQHVVEPVVEDREAPRAGPLDVLDAREPQRRVAALAEHNVAPAQDVEVAAPPRQHLR